MVCTPGDVVQQFLDLSEHIRRHQVRAPAFGNDIDVPLPSDAIPVPPKVFPGEAFDPISPNGLSHFFRRGDPDAARLIRWDEHGHEIGGMNPSAVPEEMEKLLPFPKPVRLGERCSAQIRRPVRPEKSSSRMGVDRRKTATRLIASFPWRVGG